MENENEKLIISQNDLIIKQLILLTRQMNTLNNILLDVFSKKEISEDVEKDALEIKEVYENFENPEEKI